MEDSCSPIKMIGDVQVWGPWDGYMGRGTSMLVFGRVGSGGQANCHMAVMLGTFVVSSILH